jgi:glycerol kinase
MLCPDKLNALKDLPDMSTHILVIDEGTTSTRAIAYDRNFKQVAVAQIEIPLSLPNENWVEQDGEAIWTRTREVCQTVIAEIGGAEAVAAIGITNQRETTLVWDRATGKPIGPAIVWQDRRTEPLCADLRKAGHMERVRAATGLQIDPYFSATKIGWLLDNVEGARSRAEAGDLAFGTVDTFLIWHLTGGKVHASDVTNASRTMLYGLQVPGGAWSEDMLDLFNVPKSVLPEVRESNGAFGETAADVFGKAIPILSAIGDQQAALVGQGCLTPGSAKMTYGTGGFLVANTGDVTPVSEHKLLGTIGYDIADFGGAYALEGSIFNAGTVVQWLRDELGFMRSAVESEAMAASLEGNGGIYIVPAFTGLGAPHWDADARGAITGITRGTTAAHLVRAGLEAAAYQTLDLLTAFEADGAGVDVLHVDGGMAANDWLMQFLADVCAVPVVRPDYGEMTALGAGALAGMALGWVSPEDWAARARPGKRFEPKMTAEVRDPLIDGWRAAVGRVLTADG